MMRLDEIERRSPDTNEPLSDEEWDLQPVKSGSEEFELIASRLQDMEGDLFDKSQLEVYWEPISGNVFVVKHGEDYYVWDKREADDMHTFGFEEIEPDAWPPTQQFLRKNHFGYP